MLSSFVVLLMNDDDYNDDDDNGDDNDDDNDDDELGHILHLVINEHQQQLHKLSKQLLKCTKFKPTGMSFKCTESKKHEHEL